MSTEEKSVYELFITEMDGLIIAAQDPVAKVVGDLTRAVKRAQMVHDGELPTLSERLRPADDTHLLDGPMPSIDDIFGTRRDEFL